MVVWRSRRGGVLFVTIGIWVLAYGGVGVVISLLSCLTIYHLLDIQGRDTSDRFGRCCAIPPCPCALQPIHAFHANCRPAAYIFLPGGIHRNLGKVFARFYALSRHGRPSWLYLTGGPSIIASVEGERSARIERGTVACISYLQLGRGVYALLAPWC